MKKEVRISSNETLNDLAQAVVRYFSSSRIHRWIWSVIRGVLVGGISFIILHPLLIKLSSSLMTERDLYDLHVQLIPRDFRLRRIVYHYQEVAESMEYGAAFLNSFTLALTVSILQLVACTIIGYGFARFKFRGNSFFFALVILTLLVPPQMVMVPLFLNFRFFDFYGLLESPGMNLLGTYWPFVLTSVTGTGLRNGLFIYIMRQHFKGMPRTLEEAALVDGAGAFKTFYTIMLPGATPVLLIVFLFSFVWQWNDIFLTSMYMRRSATLLPFTLSRLASEYDMAGYSTDYTTVINNTGMILFLAPLLVLYAFLQRFFIESVERTGIVG